MINISTAIIKCLNESSKICIHNPGKIHLNLNIVKYGIKTRAKAFLVFFFSSLHNDT